MIKKSEINRMLAIRLLKPLEIDFLNISMKENRAKRKARKEKKRKK